MKHLFAAALIAYAIFSASALPAQQPGAKQPNTTPPAPQASPSPTPALLPEAAQNEISEGTRLSLEGRYAEAQAHFERAAEIAPEFKNARLFIARAIQQQYRAGDTTPENVARAHAAIEAYKRFLSDSPDNDDASLAVAYLYRELGEKQAEREWLLERARSETVSREKRGEAFLVVASVQLKCASDITEQKENKATAKSPDTSVVYRKPKDEVDFSRAMDCATDALHLVDSAIEFNQQDPRAWRYKAAILNELAKLSQMEEKPTEQAEYIRRMNEAQAEYERVGTTAQGRGGSSQNSAGLIMPIATSGSKAGNNPASARNRADTPSGGQRLVSGGILTGKAIHNPPPSYPEEARAAQAAGTVTVQITFDETGKVVEAKALSGHPLLRAPAVEAARKARFAPVKIAGQPVRVRGVVTYTFVLR